MFESSSWILLQDTDGIFPNAAISKKMGDILGPHHTIPVQTEVKKE